MPQQEKNLNAYTSKHLFKTIFPEKKNFPKEKFKWNSSPQMWNHTKGPKLISLRYILNGPQWKLQKQFLFKVKESWTQKINGKTNCVKVWLLLKSRPNFRHPLPRIWKTIHTEREERYQYLNVVPSRSKYVYYSYFWKMETWF